MKSYLSGLLTHFLIALSLGLATPVLAEDGSTLIILDGSGSMWGRIEDRTKADIARAAVTGILEGMTADRVVGLMSYGHRRRGDCSDIEMIVPPEAGAAGRVADAVARLRFLGKTPLTAAVREAAQSMRITEQTVTIVLVTDGIETCNADPCALGAELEAAGVNFTAHVIGFGLSAEEGAQVACLAEATGGQYFEAQDGSALVEALANAVAVPPVELEPPPLAGPWYPGATLMPDTQIIPTGSTTLAPSAEITALWPDAGSAADCEALCESEASCAAWVYEPSGSYFIDYPRCTRFDAAAELDYGMANPADGWASGIRDGLEMLVRPWPEEIEEAAASGPVPVPVTFAAADGGLGLFVSWSAVPLPEQPLPPEAWALPERVAGAVTAELLPGRYAVTGDAGDTVFAAEIEVAAGGETSFVIPADPTRSPAGEDTQAVAAEDTEAAYACDRRTACEIVDRASGLAFVLPSGWHSDVPFFAETAGGVRSDLPTMTFSRDGESLAFLNPLRWLESDGSCLDMQPGALCLRANADEAAATAFNLIAGSLRLAPTQATAPENVARRIGGTILPRDKGRALFDALAEQSRGN